MQFNFTYGASVNSAPAGFTSTIQAAGNYLSAFFRDNITINIHVGFGEVNGSTVTSLGVSSTLLQNYTYTQIRNAFGADVTSLDDSTAYNNLPASSPFIGANYWLARAQAKALGLQSASSDIDAYIGFNSTAIFDYDRSNGISLGAYDFYGAAVHEISHAMGRILLGGGLFGGLSNSASLQDLFHYDYSQDRTIVGSAPNGYFSIDGGVTHLRRFNTNSSGDYGDWEGSNSPGGIDAFDAFGRKGTGASISWDDLRVMDVLGYNHGGVPVSLNTRADFGGDSKSDLVWEHKASGALSIWEMSGAGIVSNQSAGMHDSVGGFTTGYPYELIDNEHDYSGDGKADFIWRNPSVGSVTMWIMSGSQTLFDLPVADIDNNWRFQGGGDFNGDGNADMIWRHAAGDVSLWTMNGGAITVNTAMPTIDNNWKLQGLGDFNADSKSDVLWRHVSGQIVFWQMNGSTIIDNKPLQAQVDLSWHVAGAGDFNGDGKTDIVWRHNSGFVSLWEMNGYNIANNTAIADVGNEWKIETIADFNGDGKSDLIWRHADGFVSIWQMDGNAIASNLAIGQVSQDYKINAYHTPDVDFV